MTPEQLFRIQLDSFMFGAAVTGILAIGLSFVYDFYQNSDETIKELREENKRLKGENNEN